MASSKYMNFTCVFKRYSLVGINSTIACSGFPNLVSQVVEIYSMGPYLFLPVWMSDLQILGHFARIWDTVLSSWHPLSFMLWTRLKFEDLRTQMLKHRIVFQKLVHPHWDLVTRPNCSTNHEFLLFCSWRFVHIFSNGLLLREPSLICWKWL